MTTHTRNHVRTMTKVDWIFLSILVFSLILGVVL